MTSLTLRDRGQGGEGAGPAALEDRAGRSGSRADAPARHGSERAVEQRVSMLRLLLICGIVFIHVPVPPSFEGAFTGPFPFVRAFVCDGLFRATVPVLTAISGFLLFRSGLDLRPGELVAKKSRTILLPLVVWNLPLLVLLYLAEAGGFSGHRFAVPAYPFDLWRWLDATLGLSYQPANYPLHFLRDLYVVSLLAPLFGLLVRRAPWIGLALVFAVFWLNLDGPLVFRDMMAVDFFIGGMAAAGRWNLTGLDRFWPLCLALLIGSCLAIVAWRIEDIRWFSVLAPFLIWPLSSVLARTRFAPALAAASKTSFAIFVMHAPLLLGLWILFDRRGDIAFYPLFWLLAPPVAIALAVAFRRAAYGLSPRLAALAFGSR